MATLTASKTETIAKNVVEKCRQGDYENAVRSYYAPDVVNVEAMAMPGKEKEIRGFDAVLQHNIDWVNNTEVHKSEVLDPLVSGNHFVVKYATDVTCKQTGQRMQMEELGLYEVKDDKITRAEFIYSMTE